MSDPRKSEDADRITPQNTFDQTEVEQVGGTVVNTNVSSDTQQTFTDDRKVADDDDAPRHTSTTPKKS